jgi:hypothetical protein
VLADGSDEINRAWARAAWYWLAVAVAFSLGAALLAGGVALNPELATTASLIGSLRSSPPPRRTTG